MVISLLKLYYLEHHSILILYSNGEHKMSSVFVHDFEKAILSDPLKEV